MGSEGDQDYDCFGPLCLRLFLTFVLACDVWENLMDWVFGVVKDSTRDI